MNQQPLAALLVPALTAFLPGQYRGEPPSVVQAAGAFPSLNAAALGVSQVAQLSLVPHPSLGAHVYYCCATVIKTGNTHYDLKSGIFDANTATYTPNTDVDGFNTSGDEFSLTVSPDLRYAAYDSPAGQVFWAARAGTTGAFGTPAPTNVLAYSDPNFGTVGGRLVLLYASSASAITAGDFNPSTGQVSNLRTVATRVGTSNFVHSPTPMNDRNGVTRALIWCESVTTDAKFVSGLEGNPAVFTVLDRGPNWLANGDCNGGTLTLAEAVGVNYGDPVQVGLCCLSSAVAPSTGGTATLTAFMPARSASAQPYVGTVVFGFLGAGGLPVPLFTGQFSLGLSPLLSFPALSFDNVSGTIAYTFPTPRLPVGSTLYAQAAVVEVATLTGYFSNTAQLRMQ